MVNSTTYSFQAGGNFLWSEGNVNINDEDPNRASCNIIWNDNDHDQYVEYVISQKNIPQYGIGPQAADCQEWSNEVLEEASDLYDQSHHPYTVWGVIKDIFWYGP
ncbi:hypothetical Protein YC6258_01301 [Gynuella sunshinyii YC6258]|uniref:Uncharacterized protein n=1 Tax=Gynuella sunshinyii YC6258 TaxID=1445510 RepID=A0A0C5VSR7_9GAMM|nr:hypothetical Protein YC6258_01301 [Gynuella sunshinyii YC6258]